jgi:hypothetical protein
MQLGIRSTAVSDDRQQSKDGVLMESIMRIVTAVAAGAVAADSEVAGQGVKNAYAGLKTLVLGRLSGKAEVDAAIRLLEQKPDSEGRKTALAEELAVTMVSAFRTPLLIRFSP